MLKNIRFQKTIRLIKKNVHMFGKNKIERRISKSRRLTAINQNK